MCSIAQKSLSICSSGGRMPPSRTKNLRKSVLANALAQGFHPRQRFWSNAAKHA